jgi:hypothetical protein
MRFWGKLKTEDRIIRDLVQEDKDFQDALVSLCARFDISKPIVCDKHLKELRSFRRTLFYRDDFVESVDFDTLEIEIIDIKKNKPV